MAAYIIPTCPSGGIVVSELIGATQYQRFVCPTASAGKWLAIQEHPDFDVSQLDKTQLGAAFAAGFLVMGMAIVMAIPVRAIVKAVRNL